MVPDRVLIVDDEAVVLDVLCTALERKDLEVRQALTMAAALEALRKEPIGLLLADKNLPDGDGVDLIRQARVLQPNCACMVMTGYPNFSSILVALRLGAVDYLEKPFPRLEIVQEKVRAALDRQKLLVERELLQQKLEALERGQGLPGALQQAVDAVKEDAEQSLAAMRASCRRELSEVQARAELLAMRLTAAQAALRRTARMLATMVGPGPLGPDHAAELEALRGDIAEALEEL